VHVELAAESMHSVTHHLFDTYITFNKTFSEQMHMQAFERDVLRCVSMQLPTVHVNACM
jgi:hypothetical protein